MERSVDNLHFCEEQILRLAVIRFWDRLTDGAKENLRDELCDTSDSQAQAQTRISTWISTQCRLPMPADFTRMAMAEKGQSPDADTFESIVNQLSIWKKFPFGEDARHSLAKVLEDCCEGKIERARWLVSQRSEIDEYPGPARLCRMIKDQFQPAGPLAPYALPKRTEDAPEEPFVSVEGWAEFCKTFKPSAGPNRRQQAQRAAETRKQLGRIFGIKEKKKG